MLLIAFVFLFKNLLISQNLISNPSFEQVDTPVYWNSGTFLNTSVFPTLRNVTDWDWYNSPDYFSTNVPYTGIFRGIPINDFGTSYPKNGNAYGGISVYEGSGGDYKEFITQQLTMTLKADSIYCLSFYTTLADRVQIAIKNMGAYFSVNIPSLVTNSYINAVPQVVNTSDFLTDTVYWTEIRGCFTALGGEKYITVGSFGNRASTDTVNTISTNPLTGPGNNFSYYYIDSVTLWQNNFPTAIKEFSKDDGFKVYPNPATTILKINYNSNNKTGLQIKINDVLGREVKALEFEEEIDISDLEKGIYFFAIVRDGKMLGVKKIVKQ